MHDLTVPKWLYLSAPSDYREPADELCLFSLSPPTFLFPSLCLFSLIPQMATAASLILQRAHFTRNKPILLFTDLVIYALCGFSLSLQLVCICVFFCFFSVSARTYVRADDIYKRMHPRVSPARRRSVAEYRLRFSCLMPFHIVILRSRCNILLFRKANYQSSQLLLANFKALSTCCSFSFY